MTPQHHRKAPDGARQSAAYETPCHPPSRPGTADGFSAVAREQPGVHQAMSGLDSQTLATLGAACVDHGTATAGLHADQEAMGAGATDFGRLVSAFHDEFLEVQFWPFVHALLVQCRQINVWRHRRKPRPNQGPCSNHPTQASQTSATATAATAASGKPAIIATFHDCDKYKHILKVFASRWGCGIRGQGLRPFRLWITV